MKKHPTSKVSYVEKPIPESSSTPWKNVFQEGINELSEAGLMLKGARLKAQFTQKELAEKLGIHTHHISEMEHGKRTIGKSMARKLAQILEVDYKLFL